MKKLFVLSFFLSLLLIPACSDEVMRPADDFEEGVPVVLHLDFQTEYNTVETRTAQKPQYEYAVDNLYIFIFTPDGAVHYRKFFTENELTLDPDHSSPLPEVSYVLNGSVRIETETLKRARIVGVANLKTPTVSTAYDMTSAKLDAVTSFSELNDLVMTMPVGSIFRGGVFMLTGMVEEVDIRGGNVQNCTLSLNRTDAKIEFNVTSGIPSGSGMSDMKLDLREWRVMRVPKQSLLVNPDDATDLPENQSDYFDTDFLPFETKTSSGEPPQLNGGGFIFYMPENLRKPKNRIPTAYGETYSLSDAYALREKRNKTPDDPGRYPDAPGQIHENTDWAYADENSTYVIMRGFLYYKNQDHVPITVELSLTVHLGFASGDPNDFLTKRNHHYVYHVKVLGSDDIIVEVNDRNEVRPGYEGTVSRTTNQLFELDGHYDRMTIRIWKDDFSQLTWKVKTPFCEGVYRNQPSYQGIEDYKWIKFALNADYGIPDAELVPFPGESNYDDPDQPHDGTDASAQVFPHQKPGARLLDINQLISRLKEEQIKYDDPAQQSTIFFPEKQSPNPSAGGAEAPYAVLTVFVDEYLYKSDPTLPYQENLQLWKTSVKGGSRFMHLLLSDSRYSPDGMSNVSTSAYTFRQEPIITVFNPDHPDLIHVWGMESIMETPPQKDEATVNPPAQLEESNGKANTITLIGENKNWSDIVSNTERYGLNPGYQSPVYACLLRNRDNNGNGKIDREEIRWYLAAIGQLKEIYIAEDAFPAEFNLYPERTYVGDKHYLSSSYSYSDGSSRPLILWSEEGASTGFKGAWEGAYGQPNPEGVYYYRCIRNLGISDDLSAIDTDFQTLYAPPVQRTVDRSVDPTGRSYVMDMSNMNPKAIRTNLETKLLPEHSDQDRENAPYRKFEILASDFPSSPVSWEEISQGKTVAGDFICPQGYRPTTQTELLILSIALHDPIRESEMWTTSETSYMTQTSFSFRDDPHFKSAPSSAPQRNCFVYLNNAERNFHLQNVNEEKAYVRCVRDVEQ